MSDRYLNFVCGFGVGVTAALLLAPKSGTDTRKYVASGLDKGRDFIKQQSDRALDCIDRSKEAISHTAKSVNSAISKKGRSIREEVAS
jgi:gas vesicle protein